MNDSVNIPAYLESNSNNRRAFLKKLGLGAAAFGVGALDLHAQTCSATQMSQSSQGRPVIEGFAEETDKDASKGWEPFSDRKIRVGLVGYGESKFSGWFGFQNHPNVEVVAVSDLFPDRCAALAQKACCNKTYPSLEEMVKDDKIEAIFVATDAPSHPRHCALVLAHGKHVCSSVPAVYGSLEDADMLLEAVKRSGLKYMMMETSAFRTDNYAMRQIYKANGLGKIVYSEGEYIHYMPKPIPSYKGWRVGSIPMWYPTHATAYHIMVTGGRFTEVSCAGVRSDNYYDQSEHNVYKNSFGTQVAIFRTDVGGASRILVTKDTPGHGAEVGRVRGTRGSFVVNYDGLEKHLPSLKRPPLPPGVPLGGHGGSHGYLMNEFVTAVIMDRKPLVDVATALNLTVPGIIANQSSLKDGEMLKIPQYQL